MNRDQAARRGDLGGRRVLQWTAGQAVEIPARYELGKGNEGNDRDESPWCARLGVYDFRRLGDFSQMVRWVTQEEWEK
jgi:hypothetical protein